MIDKIGYWLLLTLFVPGLTGRVEALTSPLPADKWQLNVTVPVEATVQMTPPSITLRVHKVERSYQVFRKGPHDLTWGSQIGTIPPGSGVWTDTNVVVGAEYEYRLYGGTTTGRSRSDAQLYGYIRSGIAVDKTTWRGRVALVVENRVSSNLAFELQRYIEDLTGDGWTVHVINTPQGQGYGGMAGTGSLHVPIRDQIIALYTNFPGEVKHVSLLGNVPQPRTGLSYSGPDGHGNKAAFGADCYYADMNGTWTDTGVNTAAGMLANLAGDGKYDQTQTPTSDWDYFELGFGRMDMPYLPEGPLLGLRNYLDKLHRYKHAAPDFRPGRRGLIRSGFDNVAETGWNSMTALVGLDNIEYIPSGITTQGLDYDQMYSDGYGPYLFYCKGDSGPARGIGGRAVIWTGLQSYWGYWYENGSMGDALAEDSFTLSYTWSIWGTRYFYHRLGLSDVMGDMMRTSINNRGWYSTDGLHRMDSYYWPNGDRTGTFFMNHLGDPLLRLYMFPPARNLAAAPNGGGVRLNWEASEDPDVAGYHVYRSTSMQQPFTRLTSSPVATTTYTDGTVTSGTHIYMVRAVKLDTSASGTFWNGSQGIFRTINLDATPSVLSVTPTNLTAAHFDSPYTASLVATGGYPAYAWSLQSGRLPAGVQLSVTGKLSGNPTESGNFPITVAVADASGTVATRSLALTVQPVRQRVFVSEADAHALQANPTGNYGAVREMTSGDGYFFGYAYLRFTGVIPANLTHVTRATLRVYPNENTAESAPDSVDVALVDEDAWTEDTLNWNNRPADSMLAPPVSRVVKPAFGVPYDLDVTSLVNADRTVDASGKVSLRIGAKLGGREARLRFPSRESLMQAYRPELILEYGAGPQVTLVTPAGGRCAVAPGKEVWLAATVAHPNSNPASLVSAWSVVRQPTGATVEFSAPNAAATSVAFDREGTYVLRLTASEGVQSATVDAVVEVSAFKISAVPAPEIVHFTFDESDGSVAHNRAGGPNGTLVNFHLTNAWGSAGKMGGALSFAADDGANRAHVVALPHAAYDFALDRPWTVSLWVKMTQGNVDVAGKAVATLAEKQLRLRPEGSNGRTSFCVGGDHRLMDFNERVINDGQWRMMTVVNVPSQKIAFGFVDGGFGGVRFIARGIETTTADFLIGTVRNASNTDTEGDYDGLIDDVRVYDRALSFAEVRQLYEAQPLNSTPVIGFVSVTNVIHPGVSVTLEATVSDDGLPADGALTYRWEQASGPGRIVFGTSNAPVSTATFSVAGDYVVRLIADDGDAAGAATMRISVVAVGEPNANLMPVVNAGADRNFTAPPTVTLAGSATDDGRPGSPAQLTYLWRQLGGPGGVTFADATQPGTTARLPGFGVYVLELTTSDGVLTGADTVTLTVAAEINALPTVDAGPSGTAEINKPYPLQATASDDGRPNPPGALTYNWSKFTGWGTATFSSTNVLNPTVTFNAVGEYYLRLTVSDGESTVHKYVPITCIYDDTGNAAPGVNVGPDREVTLPDTLLINTTVTDDGLPNPPGALTVTWEKISGPGTAVMVSLAGNTQSTLSFDQPGVYELRLTVSDRIRQTADSLTVTVNAGSQYRQVWGWGRNLDGQLGPFDMTRPYRVEQAWRIVALGRYASIAQRFDGRVVGAGNNSYGSPLGGNAVSRRYFAPVPEMDDVLAVAFSETAVAIVRPDRTVWTWGWARDGQLGDGSTTNRTVPAVVPGLTNIADVVGREYGFIARNRDGQVWAWGRNNYGQLGMGSTSNLNVPQQVPGLSDVTQIAKEWSHTLFLKEDGTVWACGSNFTGLLGDGTPTNRLSPVQVLSATNPVTPLTSIRKVACGTYHSLALDNAGQVWTWGSNSSGQLGDGSTVNRNFAQRVKDPDDPSGYLTGVTDIASMESTSFALKSDGTVVGWGDALYGYAFGSAAVPVGTQNRLFPMPVEGLPAGIRSIWAGGRSAFGMTEGANYASFASSYFTPEEITAGLAAPEHDYLGMGRSNLLVYAFDGDPKNPAWRVPMEYRVENGQFLFEVEYLNADPDLEISFETSTDLRIWNPAVPLSADFLPLGDLEKASLRFSLDNARLFLRTKVRQQSP